MREIKVQTIIDTVASLCKEANYHLGEDVLTALVKAQSEEQAVLGQDIIGQLITNATIADEEEVPICQDTGFAVFFVELGQEVHIAGGLLDAAINEGVRQGYNTGFLRKSIVGHPLARKNTGDNTPAIIHITLVAGENIKIIVAPKGGGSENMSSIKMLKPSEGVAGVKKFVLETVQAAGANACPPIIVGVGIGGTFEKCALLAKLALLRTVGVSNQHADIAGLEQELLAEVNKLGIGPQGLGGNITALAVQIEIFPAHIASLPVAVNINCHAARHKEAVI